MERLARHPEGEISVKAEREQILHSRFVTFDGKSDQGDFKVRLAPAGSARIFGIPQYDTADPKADPAPDANDLTLRTTCVRSGSIAWVRAGEEIDAEDELAVGTGGKAIKADSAVAASLATGKVSDNNAITYTAVDAGDDGNDLAVEMLNTGKEKALSVDVDGDTISVTLATNGTGAGEVTSTAAQVIAAIAEHDTASQLVKAANTGASSGAGVVAAVAKTSLAGGTESATAVAKALTDGAEVDDYIEIEVY
jgi:hypothetical protein